MLLRLPVVIALLAAATALAIGAKRARVPYNVALVVGGTVLAVSGLLPHMTLLRPDVVFLACLPVLLFEGGVTADIGHVRANAVPIALLSTLGMTLAIGATSTALRVVLSLPWEAALLLGATLSVTDTVSILYAFRRAAVPSRLAGIMEGESLFNDGTALVAYGTIATVVARGGGFNAPSLVLHAAGATVGGIFIGLAAGLVAGTVLRRTDDPPAEIMATTTVAYAAYVGAEYLHVSGVIAVVCAGLTVGAALRREVAPQSRVAINSFWDYVAFGTNTFLFLAVGIATVPRSLAMRLPQILGAVACVFAGRAVAIYLPFALLTATRPTHSVPLRWQHVFVLGNIKGALSIALALGLPANTPSRQLLIEVAFGVTFISLVVQGLMLTRVLHWLGLVQDDPITLALAEQRGRLVGARAAQQELDALHTAGLVPRAGYDQLRGQYQVTIAGAERALRKLQAQHHAHGARAVLATQRRLVDAERTAILAARRSALLPEETAARLLAEIDRRLLEIEAVLTAEEGESPTATEQAAREPVVPNSAAATGNGRARS